MGNKPTTTSGKGATGRGKIGAGDEEILRYLHKVRKQSREQSPEQTVKGRAASSGWTPSRRCCCRRAPPLPLLRTLQTLDPEPGRSQDGRSGRSRRARAAEMRASHVGVSCRLCPTSSPDCVFSDQSEEETRPFLLLPED